MCLACLCPAGFTPMCKRLAPSEVMHFLNSLFSRWVGQSRTGTAPVGCKAARAQTRQNSTSPGWQQSSLTASLSLSRAHH